MPSAHSSGTTLRHGFASQGNAYTSYQFTSQRNETALGLYFYNARWYDPSLGRFTSADTLVPGGVQGYDRYAYTSNNPVKYVDPSGHWKCHGSDYQCQIRARKMGEAEDPQYDVTEFLIEEMRAAGEEGLMLREMYGGQGGLLFVYSFMFGKYWRYGPKNIKEAMLRDIGEGVILCGSDECRWVDYSTPGNILFGYAVEAAGMSEEFYSWVGGFEQMGDDWVNPNESVHREWCSTSYCDDPYDLAAVQFGAQLYRDYKSDITFDIFQTELTTDVLGMFQPPPSSFTAPFSPHPQNNYYMPGDFDYVP